ncbi:MAG: 4Fe-4S binding protein [Candidatus Bathyarchaeia archaeon]|jgi:polyferredoxin
MNRQKARLALAIGMVFLFPLIYYYLSPYVIIMGATAGIIAGDAIVFAGLFVSSLFLGRVWCGWICPAGAIQELCIKVNSKRFNGKKCNLVKYFIWAPWLSLTIVLFIQAGGVKSVDLFYQTWNGISIQNVASAIMFAVIAGSIAVFSLATGRRAACHTICWMAPFMIAGTKIKNGIGYPSLHLEADKSLCVECKQCSNHCPMSLNVNEMVQNKSMANTECILCGSCVDTCPKKAIKFSFSGLRERLKVNLSTV